MDTRLSIVLVEDNDDLRESIVDALISHGHVVVAKDCAEALPEASIFAAFDLAIIDVNLPGEDGFSLAKRIRQVYPDVGIIIMTARNASLDKRIGYEVGADIYITKPFELAELLATIQALGRRLSRVDVHNSCLLLDRSRMVIEDSKGNSSTLTSSEMSLLTAFSLSPGMRLEKWQIIDLLSLDKAEDPAKAMVLVIVRLRKKLEELGVESPVIKMIRGWGYQLCAPIKVH